MQLPAVQTRHLFASGNPPRAAGAYAWGERFVGEDMAYERLRTEAIEKRRLAANARRLAEAMHQPEVRRDLMTQAFALEQLAQELEGILIASDD